MSAPRSPLAVLLLAAAAVAGCADVSPLAMTATGTQTLEVTIPAGASPVTVRVEMFNGPIKVEAGAAGRVSAVVTTKGSGSSNAEAEADRAKIQVTLDANSDGSVLLRAVYQPNPASPNNRAASAVVEVPPGAALDLRTSNGAVTTTGVAGVVDVRTSNGAVTLADLGAGATVRTSNGAVEIAGSGTLDVETSNGKVIIQGTDATVRASTSNGDLSFEGTFSGGPQALQTSNNPITVRLPATASFSLDARTSNADVTVDGFSIRTTGAASGGTLQGTVGTGGPSITLRTSNAPIVVSAQ
jgi:phage baseplate assembly protein gpV